MNTDASTPTTTDTCPLDCGTPLLITETLGVIHTTCGQAVWICAACFERLATSEVQ